MVQFKVKLPQLLRVSRLVRYSRRFALSIVLFEGHHRGVCSTGSACVRQAKNWEKLFVQRRMKITTEHIVLYLVVLCQRVRPTN
jgi:hypothetical protein